MAKALPKFTRQLQPVADTTALKRDPNLQSQAILAQAEVDSAVLNGFANVAKVGGQIALDYRNNHNKTQLSLMSKEMESVLASYPEEAGKLNKVEDLEIFKDNVIEKIKSIQSDYGQNIYGNKAKKQIDTMGASAMLSIDAIAEQAGIEFTENQYAGVLYNIIHDSQNIRKPIPINPDTGITFEDELLSEVDPKSLDLIPVLNESGETTITKNAREVAHNHAVDELLRLKKINIAQASKMRNEYGFKTNYLTVNNMAYENPEEARRLLNELDMSTEQVIQASKVIDANLQKQEEEIERLQLTAIDDINTGIDNDELSFEELQEAANEVATVMGKTVPLLSDEFVELKEIQLTQDINAQTQANPEEAEAVEKALQNITNDLKKGLSFPTSKNINDFYKALGARFKPDKSGVDIRTDLQKNDPIFNRNYIRAQESILKEIINLNQKDPVVINSYEYGSDIITSTIKENFILADEKQIPLIIENISQQKQKYIKFLTNYSNNNDNEFPPISEINKYFEGALGNYLSSNSYQKIIDMQIDEFGDNLKLETYYTNPSVQAEYINRLEQQIQSDYEDVDFILREAEEFMRK
jgi:hypothetical protein